MRYWPCLVLCGALMLSGCSVTLAVRGQVDARREMFVGTVVAQINAGGTISVTSDKGAVCQGEYVVLTAREGRGTLTCQDGRSGPFEFVTTGRRGTGYGRLGGDAFTFTFAP